MASRTDLSQRREAERYRRLRNIDHLAYERAVAIGSIAAVCANAHMPHDEAIKLGHRVESAVVSLVLDLIDTKAVEVSDG